MSIKVYIFHYFNKIPKFSSKSFLTGIERTVESPCPITGQYVGEIVDIPGMCAELSSNCQTREIMYFRVSDCHSRELYEGMQTYFK